MHHPLERIRSAAGRRFLFAFVRDPLDWWRSYWSHRMRNGWVRHPVDNACRADDFQEFMENVVGRLPGYCSAMYCRFVGERHRPIHFVGRFENLVEDLVEALRLAGEGFDECAIHSTPPANVNDYARRPAQCSQGAYEAVLQSEREAIERFDY